MNIREKLAKAVGLVAWGYVFIYFDLNLGPFDILPNFVGYMFMLNSLETLAIEERSTILLKPLVYILIVWEMLQWLNAFINLTPAGYLYTLANTIVIVVSLYYNFQLLTNLAAIAQKYDCYEERNIILLRTIYTLLITFVALPLQTSFIPEYIMDIIPLVMIFIVVIIIFASCLILFSFKHSLNNTEVE